MFVESFYISEFKYLSYTDIFMHKVGNRPHTGMQFTAVNGRME